MKPDTSRWRDQSQYEFYDALPVEGVAWECLRRNTAYQASFDYLVTQDAGHLPLSDDVQRRWGLRFPGRPPTFCARPTGRLPPRTRDPAGSSSGRRQLYPDNPASSGAVTHADRLPR